MPYGFNKSLGGDSPDNDAAIERCVSALVAKGHDKVEAIKICKHARAVSLMRGGRA